VLGSAAIYLTGRRSGRLAARRRELRDAATDERSKLSAATGVLAQQLIDLDDRFGRPGSPSAGRYRELSGDYVQLLARISAADRDGGDLDGLATRVESLSSRARALAD
jgi:hypothetical protein